MKLYPLPVAPDEILLQRLRADDTMALTDIFNRYWEKLYAAADRVIDDEAGSKDIVQEIFITLWERRSQTEINNLGAYLMRAVKFKVANYFRNNSLKEKHLQRIQDLMKPESLTLDANDFNAPDIRDIILKLIDNLPTRCREVFYLSRIEQLSNTEIATRLGISVRTVETQISKALKHIKPILKSTSVESLIVLLLVELASW